jgi:hypothetical protein
MSVNVKVIFIQILFPMQQVLNKFTSFLASTYITSIMCLNLIGDTHTHQASLSQNDAKDILKQNIVVLPNCIFENIVFNSWFGIFQCGANVHGFLVLN